MTTFEIDTIGLLRLVRDADLEQMLEWRNAPNVRKNSYSQHEITLADHLTWWNDIKGSQSDMFFVFEDQNTPLGIVSLNDIDEKNKSAFWGIYASPLAPKGTGTRMKTLLLDCAFSVLKLNKLSGEILEKNSLGVGLSTKLGFTQEGFFRDHRFIGDQFVNVFRFAMLAADWETHRKRFLPAPYLEAHQ